MPEKANVRLADKHGIVNPLTGGLGQSVDGQTVAAADPVFLLDPPNGPAYIGPWIAAAGAWTRAPDWNWAGAEKHAGDWWYVEEGSRYQGTTFHCETTGLITLNTTALTVGKRTHRRAIEESGGVDISGSTPPFASLTNTGILPGTYSELTVGADGRATGGTAAASAASDFAGFDTFVEGLDVEWVSANALTAKAGSAWIPGDGALLDAPSDIAKTGLTFLANTWYHVYFFNNAGAPDIERATVAPSAPYRGGSRTRSDNASKRLLRSVRAGASANTVRRFEAHEGWVYWQEDTTASPYRVVTAGTQGAAWSAAISCANVVPPTARVALVRVAVPGGQNLELGNNGTSSITQVSSGATTVIFPFVLSASQALHYRHPGGAPGTGSNIDILGYLERT